MKRIPSIESVMTLAPACVAIDDPVHVAEDLMIDREIRHLPVLDGETLVGIVSDRDIAGLDNEAESEDLAGRLRVRDVCSLDFFAVEVGEPLDGVVREMGERRIGSAIVTQDGRLVGLFTVTDALRCFADFLRSAPRSRPPRPTGGGGTRPGRRSGRAR